MIMVLDLSTEKYSFIENDAITDGSNPFGNIVDYNETITPVIGTTKPSNFTLLKEVMVLILTLML